MSLIMGNCNFYNIEREEMPTLASVTSLFLTSPTEMKMPYMKEKNIGKSNWLNNIKRDEKGMMSVLT